MNNFPVKTKVYIFTQCSCEDLGVSIFRKVVNVRVKI